MKILMLSISILVFLFTSLHTAELEEEQELLKAVIEGIKYNDSLLNSATVDVKIVTYGYDERKSDIRKNPWTIDASLKFKGEKLRLKYVQNEKGKQSESDIAYNGEHTTIWDGRRLAVIFPGLQLPGLHTERLDIRYWMQFWRIPLDKIISDHFKSAKLLGEENINGDLCFRVQVTFSNNAKAVFFINMTKGYRLQESYEYLPNGLLVAVRKIELAKAGKEIWYPQHCDKTIYCYDEKGKLVDSMKAIFDFENFKPNVPIDEESFIIDFPSGTYVTDHESNRSYKVP